jgi:putative restriction endonuclease
MKNRHFGDVDGIKEGDVFPDRQALHNAGVHLPTVAGIDGDSITGSSSIVLNAGYVDDLDLGDEIIYTGHGGNKDGKQVEDQSWDGAGNKGLLISELQGLPVRVTRGYKHKSPLSPKSGYQYSGLYQVTDHFEEVGKHGFIICRFRLEKIASTTTSPTIVGGSLPAGTANPGRTQSTVLRIVRDTAVSRETKRLYNYQCQVCGITIEVKGVRYAEGAHIKPLGKPHDGADQPDNLLCLCPNHHVMFDKGVFSINDDFTLHLIGGKLSVHPKHVLDISNLKYHREHICIN